MRAEPRALIGCLLAAALFGASTPAAKSLLPSTGPLVLSGLLYAGAALAVLPWALSEPARWSSVDRVNRLRLGGAVLFGGVLGPVLLLIGLALAPAGSVALWLNLETVATALFARAFFKEHLHAKTWLAIALVVAGSVLLSPTAPGGGIAIVFVALACVAWGLDNNLTSVIDRVTPSQITLAKGVGAGVVNLGLGLVIGERLPASLPLVLALGLGAFSYGLSLRLYIGGAQALGATRSQLVFSTAPAWGLALSWTVLGEPISGLQIAAAALMGMAIWLWHRERHSHVHTHAAVTHTHWHRHDDEHHDHTHDPAVAPESAHSHEHTHDRETHEHPHRPDLHHRHSHSA